MKSARRGEFQIGKFTVRYTPLPEGRAMLEGMWTRYSIWYKGKCIGSMISVPTESDCQSLLSQLSQARLAELEQERKSA